MFSSSLRRNQKFWWIGLCGHEWESTLASRLRGSNCPVCANRIILKGTNDLGTLDPQLASEWHPVKNFPLLPEHVAVRSGKKVWWKDNFGHEWESTIANRTYTGCPYCSGNSLLEGFNDLASKNPHLAAEWHRSVLGWRSYTY